MTIYLVLDSSGYPVEAFDTLAAASLYASYHLDHRVLRIFVNRA
jgi:hypothetical protein